MLNELEYFGSVKKCLKILSAVDRRKYLLVVLAQSFLSFLDLFGIAIIGVVGLMAIRGVQSQPLSGVSLDVVEYLNLDNLSLQAQVAILGSSAAISLVVKTVLSMYLNWKIMSFLASRSASISANLISKAVAAGPSVLQGQNISQIQHVLGPGVFGISTGVLGTLASVLADFSSMLMISVAILLIDPVIGTVSILIFSVLAISLYFGLRVKIENFGKEFTDHSIKTGKLLLEMVSAYRQIFVSNKLGTYLTKIDQSRSRVSKLNAINSFLPGIGKYAIEITIILGGLGIAAALFSTSDSARAFAGLGIFIASGARIAPALLRLQQGFLMIKSHISVAYLTLDLIDKLRSYSSLSTSFNETDFIHSKFQPEIVISNVKFKYNSVKEFQLDIENLVIKKGTFIAIVGPSGAGKSTLVDLMLGVFNPNSGEVLISGVWPKESISRWPGAIGFVPQDIFIKEGSIKENVAFGHHASEISYPNIEAALEIAQLTTFLSKQPQGIDTQLNERGSNLSGGQRQRLAIARALYTKPKILILDEATSSLDGVLEEDITLAISNSLSDITRIVIAHRLSTVRFADKVLYMDKGKIIASGTFSEVRAKVPDFDKSAGLLGI